MGLFSKFRKGGGPSAAKRNEPEVRRAQIVVPGTGEPLPGWADKALYYLRSRTTKFLLLIIFGLFGGKLGVELTDGDMSLMIDNLSDIIKAAGVLGALWFNAKRRWQPPVCADGECPPAGQP